MFIEPKPLSWPLSHFLLLGQQGLSAGFFGNICTCFSKNRAVKYINIHNTHAIKYLTYITHQLYIYETYTLFYICLASWDVGEYKGVYTANISDGTQKKLAKGYYSHEGDWGRNAGLL